MTTTASLRAHLPYTGEAPFGSCFQQGVANVLEAMGLERAELAIGTTWGVSWQGGATLRGSGRWVDAIAALYSMSVRWIYADSWPAARAVEEDLLARGLPVVAGVDSFGIPSPHRGKSHLVHAVIVLDANSDGVLSCDPMNRPRPVQFEVDRYAELRGADCVDRFQMLTCEGEPKCQIDLLTAVGALACDAVRNSKGDEATLADFARWVEEHGADIDVSEVGAERLYAARLLSVAAERDDRFRGHARALGSLARRWYLLHTLMHEPGTKGRIEPIRVGWMISQLAQRDLTVRSDLYSTVCEVREKCFA
jgi:hypothetical protein